MSDHGVTEKDRETARHLFNAVRASKPGTEESFDALAGIARALASARSEASAENARLREELADWKRWADVVCTMSAPASQSFLKRPDETEKA